MGRAMRIRFLLVAAGAAALSGCATFVDGSNQYITINSGPMHYSHCVLSRPGETFNVTTPGSIHIEKSSDDLNVRCSRPGYADAVGTIPSDVNFWTLGNLATGGLTVLVDAWTGAMFEYPSEFNLPMAAGRTQPGAASAYSATYAVPPPPVQTTMPVPSTTPDGRPLSGTIPDDTAPAPETAAPPPASTDGKALPGTLPENY
jgi:hypothetical protein